MICKKTFQLHQLVLILGKFIEATIYMAHFKTFFNQQHKKTAARVVH